MEIEAEKNKEEKKELLERAAEIDEIHVLKAKGKKTFMDKAKILIYDNL